MRIINSAVKSMVYELGVTEPLLAVEYALVVWLVSLVRSQQKRLETLVAGFEAVEPCLRGIKDQTGRDFLDDRFDTYKKRHGPKQGTTISEEARFVLVYFRFLFLAEILLYETVLARRY